MATPYRKKLIPYYDETVTAALNAGALGCGISGSGPSLYALCWGQASSQNIAKEMISVFHNHQMNAGQFISNLTNTGAKIIEEIF